MGIRKIVTGLFWALVGLVRGLILVIPTLLDTRKPIIGEEELEVLKERAREVGLQKVTEELGISL